MRRSRWSKPLAFALGLSLVAAACGDDDDDTSTETTGETSETTAGGGGGENADFTACQVTDTGGVDDRSFNQTAYEGMTRAEDELGISTSVLESSSDADFDPNIQAHLDAGCDLIVTVGFLLGDATEAAAQANTDTNFAIVDFAYEADYDNLRELTFATDQAAFLAGYVAAATSETGTIGTYGGINLPTVTIFMDGLAAGIAQYNADEGADVQLVGWDAAAQDGLFTGDFTDQTKGRQTTEQLLDQGADIIMPVAGPVGLGSIEAIRAGGGGARLIWVDTDGCVSVPDACDLFLTSVQKKMDNAVFDTIEGAVNDAFEPGLYSGTLENDGVDLADFHEFDDAVPQEVKDRLEELRQQIIDGEVDPSGG